MVGTIGRLALAGAIALGAGFAVAGETEAAVDAARVAALGQRLVALVEADGADLDAELERLAATESNLLAQTWIAAARIRREHDGRKLTALRADFRRAVFQATPRELAPLADIDFLLTERLLTLTESHPEEVLWYSRADRLDNKVVQRLRERGHHWLLKVALRAKEQDLRSAAAKLLSGFNLPDHQPVSLYVDTRGLPRLDPWDARMPLENGPFLVAGMPFREEERQAQDRAQLAWAHWGAADDRDITHQPGLNALPQLSRRAARRLP